MIPVKVSKISFYPPSKGYAVILQEISGKGRKLPVIVGSYEAQAIALALERVVTPRPMTHDLLANILEEVQIDVREVMISELVDGTFYAEITVDSLRSGTQRIDSRPSDAVALALRLGSPIFVAEEVMNEAAVSEQAPSELSFEELSHGFGDTRKLLEERLEQAIEEEEYERAAEIRDRIRKLQERHR